MRNAQSREAVAAEGKCYPPDIRFLPALKGKVASEG